MGLLSADHGVEHLSECSENGDARPPASSMLNASSMLIAPNLHVPQTLQTLHTKAPRKCTRSSRSSLVVEAQPPST